MIAPSGEIKELSIPWLFQDIRAGKKSGTAVFEKDGIVKNVYFTKGDVLFASSNINDERLGEFLMREGRLTKEQFDSASAVVIKTKKKLGAVLFELGILSPKELIVQVKLQIKQIILHLFTWRTGAYRFEEGNLSACEIIPLQMSTGTLILEGVQALEWQSIRKMLPGMKTVLRPSTDPSQIFQKADLNTDQRLILSLVDGGRNIEQICTASGIGDFNALKALYLLLALKIAEVGRIDSESEKAFVQGVLSEASKIEDNDSSSPEPARVVTRGMIEEAYEAMKKQDYFQVLGVTKTAGYREIKKTFFKLAKLYHPDRHFEPQMSDMKDKLEALFSRIHDAYQTLSHDERRQAYETASGQSPVNDQFVEKKAEDYVENYAEKTVRALSYFTAGMKEFNIGNFWGAADSFAWSTRLDPVKAAYFYYLGLSLMHIPRRRHEAEENLQKAISIDPLKPEYHLDLGILYMKSGLKNKALEVYTSALQANPTSEDIRQAYSEAGGAAPGKVIRKKKWEASLKSCLRKKTKRTEERNEGTLPFISNCSFLL